MKKLIDAVDAWLARWIPGIIAWPTSVIFSILAFILCALLMPPVSFKKFCAEIDADKK